MDSIRALLLMTEGEEPVDLSKWEMNAQAYHMILLIEAGMIRGNIIEDENGEVATAITTRLTWDGHEFLNAARSEPIWNKVMEKVASTGNSVAWPIITTILTDLRKKKKLGIP
jgi:hypothetical protein